LDEPYTAWNVILDEPLRVLYTKRIITFYSTSNQWSITFQALKDYCLSVFLKTGAYTITCFFHSDTFYGQRLLSLKNNGKVHLHLIIQYEKIRTFLDPIRENIGLPRGTNKGRSLDEFIRCPLFPFWSSIQ